MRMVDRCTNERAHNYRWYGGSGVRVCERWLQSFDDFVADIQRDLGPRPDGMTLDRFPNKHGNYESGNVRWAAQLEQANNCRSNLLFTIGGRTLTLKQWSREYGVPYLKLYNAVQRRPILEAIDVVRAAQEAGSRVKKFSAGRGSRSRPI